MVIIMRMMIISLCILLVFIFLWGWIFHTSVHTTTAYYWDNLPDLSMKIYIDEWNEAETDMAVYFDKWTKTKELWIYFLNQKDLDEIDASIRKLDTYIRNLDKVMSQAEIEELRVKFNVIRESECLSFENIF